MPNHISELDTLIDMALAEDNPNGDVSAELCIDPLSQSTAKVIAKEEGVFYGSDVCKRLVEKIDDNLCLALHAEDGDHFKQNAPLLSLSGPTRSILILERILLNFLQHLCGISTITNQYVIAIDNPNIHILDTRKTRPGYRNLEKAAVKAGGGHNHRLNLSDMVLLKENHIKAFLSEKNLDDFAKSLETHRQNKPDIPIEIEVETLEELQTWPLEYADYIMLDNFSIPQIKQGLEICKKRHLNAQIEVSGNITLDNIRQYKELAIHRISIGRLTHSVKAIDLSLLIQDKT